MSPRIAVLTSGGDAQGMNAAVRAVTRTAIARGVEVFGIAEGFQGLVDGGDQITPLTWESVRGIIQLGGTIIGTARSDEFRTPTGRATAVQHLVERGIDRLVVIGGDGSLTGAATLREEWGSHLGDLVAAGHLPADVAARHPVLHVVGLVGTIDNDMAGIDMTIGADSALHRIVEAMDAIATTAASHQRTFVIEVMGRHCGYLPLRAAIAGSAEWVLIPEAPPEPGWEDAMCDAVHRGRQIGRRDTVVIVAEGAIDRAGRPITSEQVRQLLQERLGEDARVTVLGHVQRGGVPSAFDRYMSTVVGYHAVDEVLASGPDTVPTIIGLRNNRVTRTPLVHAVGETHEIAAELEARRYDRVIELRGGSFAESLDLFRTLAQVEPRGTVAARPRRIALVHAGGPAPGMNAAVRAATRFVIERGHEALGVRYGFQGLVESDLVPLGWMDVSGWGGRGGAELGVTRRILSGKDLHAIARTIEDERIDGLMMIGGWSGYEAVHRLVEARRDFAAFTIPIVCLPASIDNNLPGSETSVGADTALNSIVDAIDRIKQSAVNPGRCFVVEVMGRMCGYLALMGGLATGAERVLLNEEGITLATLRDELRRMTIAFEQGKRLGLIIRNEEANPVYTAGFICSLFAEEGQGLFSVRQAILGHLQQGGDPSPFDRILATRLAAQCVDYLLEQAEAPEPGAAFSGVQEGHLGLGSFEDFSRLVDLDHQRPKQQWWMALRGIAQVLSRSDGTVEERLAEGDDADWR